MSLNRGVVLEVFCGTAGVSCAFKQLGFTNVIAIDKFIPRAPKAAVIKLDLTRLEDRELLLSWIRLPEVRAVFLAPPCGTASMARFIEIPGEANAPKPLRTFWEPNGIAGLSGDDLLRVGAANMLYELVQEVWDLCCELNKLVKVENPTNSLFWWTSFWLERRYAAQEHVQDHAACAYGSTRPKSTRLVANFVEVHQINLQCPGNHFHEPWGVTRKGNKRVYATSLEVHYPPDLCKAIAQCFLTALLARGYSMPTQQPCNAAAQAVAGLQPAGAKIPPIVSEFAHKFAIICDDSQHIFWPLSAPSIASAKLLHTFSLGVEDVQQMDINALELFCQKQILSMGLDVLVKLPENCLLSKKLQIKIFGVFWKPEEFVKVAGEVNHPLAPELAVPKVLMEAIEFNCVNDASVVADTRLEFAKTWIKRAIQLKQDENNLRQGMDPVVHAATRGKRILLFKEMVSQLGFPDEDVCLELENGVNLVGEIQRTNMLPCKFKPPLCTLDNLADCATKLRPSLQSGAMSSGDNKVDEEVWSKTLQEVEAGWLRGPLSESQVPADAPITRRFGLTQKKGKVRLIDDYTESLINSCVCAVGSPILHTTDVACAVFAVWLLRCSKLGIGSGLHIRTFDLKSAYRQVGLSSEGRSFAYLKVFDPNSRSFKLFQSTVLPFGAVRSVHAFLRLSRALWWIGTVGCKLIWTSFYDDFICLAPEVLAASSEQAVVTLFRLTGWLFAEEGDKCSPFDLSCEALGVVFDVSFSSSGRILVSNTKSRVEELCADIAMLLKTGSLGAKNAQRLRGRMQFANAQIYGKVGKRCLKVLSDFAEGRRFKLNDKDAFFLRLFSNLLVDEKPRVVRALPERNALIFTDACYERSSRDWPCGIGGILILPDNQTFSFSVPLDSHDRQLLGEDVKKQIIFEAETLAALVALALWHDKIECMKCFLFVDNEGAKFSLLKGVSDNTVVDFLVERFAELEAKANLFLWISRVPSKSNIADEPSRGAPFAIKLDNNVNCDKHAFTAMRAILRNLQNGG